MKRIKQINNLIIKFDTVYGYSVWNPYGICLDDRMDLQQAENFAKNTFDFTTKRSNRNDKQYI